MTFGQLAALIAAIAFAVLVVFLVMSLMKVSGILKELKETVSRLNNTIDIVTKDVDNLSIEVEGLLNKANTLVDDINGKVSKTDPLFTAIGDLGETVSDLNDSTRNMASNIIDGGGKKKKKSPLAKFTRATKTVGRDSSKQAPAASNSKSFKELSALMEQGDSIPVPQTNTPNRKNLKDFTNQKPSTTAGGITVNKKEMNTYE